MTLSAAAGNQQRASHHQGNRAVEGTDGDARLDGQDRETVGGILVFEARPEGSSSVVIR
jgi:hypothetical protein